MLAERADHAVKFMAERLGASRSGFCSWLGRGAPADARAAGHEAVMRVWLESDRRFGARFVRAMPPSEHAGMTPHRVRKPMREPGMRGCTPRASKRTTVPGKGARPKPDLVRRDFASPVPACKLVGDVTCLRTGQGWPCLSTAIDLNTRMVAGWAMPGRTTADIVVSAVELARRRGYVAGNAIFHSDKGARYTSRLLAEWARSNDVRLSCSRTGNCHDNAVAESFFSTLRNEMHYRRSLRTRADARPAATEFIESCYNRRRPHSSIGYRIPAEAMGAFLERTAPPSGSMPLAA